jgi:hypothetical protein
MSWLGRSVMDSLRHGMRDWNQCRSSSSSIRAKAFSRTTSRGRITYIPGFVDAETAQAGSQSYAAV